MNFWTLVVGAILALSAGTSTIKIIPQQEEALVESFGKYQRKLKPGLQFVMPIRDRIAYRASLREQVIDIPPQQCITRDNVSLVADAVVYWRLVDTEKAFYKVQNLPMAMENLVRTQIRSEMGQLELDETFTARARINETLLRDLDEATDPWGVKVTRVELRDIVPAKAVQDSMELQMTAERRKRAAILTSEGEREAAINSARGRAEAQVLEAEARQKSVLLQAEAERQQQILKAQAVAEAAELIAQKIQQYPEAAKAIEVMLALGYFDMGTSIGRSNSSKVMFMDPRAIPATMEGIRAILDRSNPPVAVDEPTNWAS
ncbi:MAG: SPFH domain-containing protein [Pseudanabaenaceae cyanobacterium]